MVSIDLSRLSSVFRNMSVDTDTHSIEYTMYPINSKSVFEDNGSQVYMVKAAVKIVQKATGDEISVPVDFLKLPHYGRTGYVVKGKNRQIVGMYTKAHGWYLNEKTTSLSLPHLELSNERGYNVFRIYARDYELFISSHRNPRDGEVPLAVFLKAFTDYSYGQLASKLGFESVQVQNSFRKNEPLKADSIEQVIKGFFEDYRSGRKEQQLKNMGIVERYNLAWERIFHPQSTALGEGAGIRMNRKIIFRNRCLNMFLAHDIVTATNTYKEGMVLDSRTLEELDYQPLDELIVRDSGYEYHTIRKTSIYNFRALGWTLEEDVQVKGYTIAKGTVLTLAYLKDLDATNLRDIKVSMDGEEAICSRKLFTNSLDVPDIISMVQVYLDSLGGMKCFDDAFDIPNQTVITLEGSALNTLKSYCTQLNHLVALTIANAEEQDTLLSQIFSMQSFNVDQLMENITSPESTESQQAELNNTVQKVSKEYRVSKNASHTSEAMIGIKALQFGFLDHIVTPESQNVGKVHARTLLSRVNEVGELEAPYMRVEDGRVIGTAPVWLTASDKEGQYIAGWDEKFFTLDEAGNEVQKSGVRVLYNDTVLEVPVKSVTYMGSSPYLNIAPERAQLPLLGFNANKRELMGANHQKQAANTIKGQRRWVSSGGDSLLPEGIITAYDVLRDYYDANASIITEMDKESFMQQRLELVSTQMGAGVREAFFRVLATEHLAMVTIPFAQKSSSGLMYTYNLNTDKGLQYSGFDVVACSSDFDIKDYDMEYFADFGHIPMDKEIFARAAVAVSRNLLVAFKTYEGGTIDDGITLNGDLVGTDTLSNITMEKSSYSLSDPQVDNDSGIAEQEYFGFAGRPTEDYMTDEGLPRLGTFLHPGDTVITVRKVKTQYTRAEGRQEIKRTTKIISLGPTQHGQVVEAYIKDGEAVVSMASLDAIEEGDKMSGSHGNKGVVANIVPSHLMPFTEDGKIPDAILNPQGVPSRSNIAQVFEQNLNFAKSLLRAKEGKADSPLITVITPYKEGVRKYIEDIMEKAGAGPVYMRDGRTGQLMERPVSLGYLYMPKLEHRVAHKLKAVGLSKKVDPVYNQPTKGPHHTGGQAVGEMETWVLEANKCFNVLQDVMSIQSDDPESIRKLPAVFEENPYEVEVKGNNNNDQFFQMLLRTLGVEPSIDDIDGVTMRPFTDEMIRNMNPRPVNVYDKESLRSEMIFGGVMNNMERYRNRTRWSWLDLGCEMIHPMWLGDNTIFNKIILTQVSPKFVKDSSNDPTPKIDKHGNPVITTTRGHGTTTTVKAILAGTSYVVETSPGNFEVHAGISEGNMTGIPALVYILRNARIEDTRRFYETKFNNAKVDNSRSEHAQRIRNIDAFIASGIKFEDYIISALPVMPLSFRPQSPFKGQVQDFDYYYLRIMDEVSKLGSRGASDPQQIFNIYLRIVELCGLTYTDFSRNNNYSSILKKFSIRGEGNKKRKGDIRESILKKRVHNSGRSVIIPNRDTKRLPTEVGIPFHITLTIWRAQLVAVLRHNLQNFAMTEAHWDHVLNVMAGNPSEFHKLMRNHANRANYMDDATATQIYDKVYGVIASYVEGAKDEDGSWFIKPRAVLVGRQPSLHKFSVRAYRPIITDRKAIEVHPLVCKAYNADFDGDTMYVIALINDLACEEALERMSPMLGIINPKDGSVIVEHAQDMKLGIYLATMFHNNNDKPETDARYSLSNVQFYNDIRQMETDVDLGIISIHSMICFSARGHQYLSTAGRILLNSLFPEQLGFTDDESSNIFNLTNWKPGVFKALRYEGLIAGSGGTASAPLYSSLKKITKWSYETFTPEDNIMVYQYLAEMGFKYADVSGFSLHLRDFIKHPEADEKIANAERLAKQVNNRYFQGIISEKSRKELLIGIFSSVSNLLRSTMLQYFDRDNNIFIMFDSGARGNLGQVMQACGIIGVLQKSKQESLEIPILTNYSQGLSDMDSLLASYSTRNDVSSTQNGTQVSGELTRNAVYMASGIRIVEEDCGSTKLMKLRWGKPTGRVVSPDGSEVTIDDLLGKTVVEEAEYLRKVLYNFSSRGFVINKESIRMLYKHNVHEVPTTEGVYKIYYALDTLSKSLLYRRSAKNLPFLILGKHVSEKTIEHIETENLQTVEVRLILHCGSVGGICACCYGMEYDSLKVPEVGDLVGTISAQSMGEPSTQLTLSQFHSGGAAGAGVGGAVAVLKSQLESGTPINAFKGSTLPEGAGFLYYADSTRRSYRIDTSEGQGTVVDVPTDLAVENGEYVDKYTPITHGPVVPTTDNLYNPDERDIEFVQYALLELFFRSFEGSDIDVYARHFEVFVRMQTSHVTLVNPADTGLQMGERYDYNELKDKLTAATVISFKPATATEVISTYSGFPALLAFGNMARSLSGITINQNRTKGESSISKMMVGQDLTSSRRKILSLPPRITRVKEQTETVQSLAQFGGISTQDLVSIPDESAIDFSFDLDALLDVAEGKPQESQEETYPIVSESKEEKSVEKSDFSVQTSTLDLFK